MSRLFNETDLWALDKMPYTPGRDGGRLIKLPVATAMKLRSKVNSPETWEDVVGHAIGPVEKLIMLFFLSFIQKRNSAGSTEPLHLEATDDLTCAIGPTKLVFWHNGEPFPTDVPTDEAGQKSGEDTKK